MLLLTFKFFWIIGFLEVKSFSIYNIYTYTGISKISSQYTTFITATAFFSSFTFTAFVNSEVWWRRQLSKKMVCQQSCQFSFTFKVCINPLTCKIRFPKNLYIFSIQSIEFYPNTRILNSEAMNVILLEKAPLLNFNMCLVCDNVCQITRDGEKMIFEKMHTPFRCYFRNQRFVQG